MKSIRAIPTVEEVKMADDLCNALIESGLILVFSPYTKAKAKNVVLNKLVECNRQEIEERPNGK